MYRYDFEELNAVYYVTKQRNIYEQYNLYYSLLIIDNIND